MSGGVSTGDGAAQKSCAIRPRYRRIVLRPAVDAAAAWVIFGLLTAFVTCAPLTAATTPAGFAALEKTSNPIAFHAVADTASAAPTINLAVAHADAPSTTRFDIHRNQNALTLLGLTFSLFAALNLMFFRHLRRAYALPRRRALKSR